MFTACYMLWWDNEDSLFHWSPLPCFCLSLVLCRNKLVTHLFPLQACPSLMQSRCDRASSLSLSHTHTLLKAYINIVSGRSHTLYLADLVMSPSIYWQHHTDQSLRGVLPQSTASDRALATSTKAAAVVSRSKARIKIVAAEVCLIYTCAHPSPPSQSLHTYVCMQQRAGSGVAHNLLRVQYGSKKADRAIDFLTQLKEVLSKDSLNKFTNLVSAYKQVVHICTHTHTHTQ